MSTTAPSRTAAATDLDANSRDALAEVSARFAAASSHRKRIARERRARHWAPADQVMRTIGDSFQLPIVGRLA